MPAPYTLDLRTKALAAVDRGEKKSHVSRVFGISRNTLDLWLKRRASTGSVAPQPYPHRGPEPIINDLEAFRRFAEIRGHLTQQQMADEWQQLQELVRRIEALNQNIVQERNRLETATTTTRSLIEAHIRYLQSQLKATRKLIQKHFQQHPDLAHQRDLLTSIPGIGETTAALILAEMQDWRRFGTAKQFAAYIGLTPKECTSGSSVRGRPQLSRMGSRRLRKAFYLPAVVAKTHNPLIQAFCERLLSRGKNTMQVVGAAMRKLAHLAYGVLKSNQPFDPNFCQPNT